MDAYDDFQRYLTAKVTVDDRALNKDVWRALAREVRGLAHRPLRVLDVGAGVGTMGQRLWRWRLHPHVLYTGVDHNPDNVTHARRALPLWAREMGVSSLVTGQGVVLQDGERQMAVSMVAEDALAFMDAGDQQGAWDLLIAHAFLDLMDISSALPTLLATLRPGGLVWLTLNFDGVTIFEPVRDAHYETRLMAAYHASMDQRRVHGRPSGDSRTGRHLFGRLRATGARILAAGASDWVIIPHSQGGYPHDEAYFLHFIIHTIHLELQAHPEVGGARLEAWAAWRHDQIDQGALLYVAHQLDYLVIVDRNAST